MKRQIAKLNYDSSAGDLPELNVGQPIRMKPLPGDRTGRWRKGVCLQQVGPRSYVVNVEGTTGSILDQQRESPSVIRASRTFPGASRDTGNRRGLCMRGQQ